MAEYVTFDVPVLVTVRVEKDELIDLADVEDTKQDALDRLGQRVEEYLNFELDGTSSGYHGIEVDTGEPVMVSGKPKEHYRRWWSEAKQAAKALA